MFEKYKIKEKTWSFWGAYEIFNSNDRLIYEVKGEPFSFRSNYTMRNGDGIEVCQITRKIFSFNRKFFIRKNGVDLFRVVRSWNIFKSEIFVDSLQESDAFIIQGNIWQKEFAFYRNQNEFAYVSKKMWTFKDTYGVAVDESENIEIVLALVVIIDLINSAKEK